VARRKTVAEARNYRVTTVAEAKSIASRWLDAVSLTRATTLGLPEIDDRYHIWRVPVRAFDSRRAIGEIVINARTTEILDAKTTRVELLESRLLKREQDKKRTSRRDEASYPLSPLRNTIGLGDSAELLQDVPAESIDLVFTSPPYFNARPEYSEYEEYRDYLHAIGRVLRACHRALVSGRFLVINTSPVLLRRASRNESSRRIAVPFDLHAILEETGFEFVDDIIWVKPEGAGWATGRGRRFAADRNPLQYKAVPVTEYVLVYRKRSSRLIDWFIRKHPDRECVSSSKIPDGYERTNIWRISPSKDREHPAGFPLELADKVLRYYSFKGDVVLDPFAGGGTTGAAAAALGRRFVLFDINSDYVELMKKRAKQWLGKRADQVLCVNTTPIDATDELL
jgi:DNA modification methylase